MNWTWFVGSVLGLVVPICYLLWKYIRAKEELARMEGKSLIHVTVYVFRLKEAIERTEYGSFTYSYPDRALTLADMKRAMAAAYFSYCGAHENSEYATGHAVEVCRAGEQRPAKLFLIMPGETPEVALDELRNVLEQIKPVHVEMQVSAGAARIEATA